MTVEELNEHLSVIGVLAGAWGVVRDHMGLLILGVFFLGIWFILKMTDLDFWKGRN